MSEISVKLEESSALANKQVGQIVAEFPLCAAVFEKFGIDYCCGGKIRLEDACKKKGVSITELIEKLINVSESQSSKEPDWTKTTLSELVDHIISTYHVPLKEQLTRILQLSEKVARVHGDNHQEMRTLAKVFAPFKAELEMHMQKEEMVLFPGIKKMESSNGADTFFGCGGSIEHPIQMMTYEHDEAGRVMAEMRRLCNNYQAPLDACNSYRALFAELEDLERCMHNHVHKENNILFPRAIKMQPTGQNKACGHSQ